MKKPAKTSAPAPSKVSQATTPAVLPKLATADAGATLTDDQMQQLAQSFHDISVAIGQVRLDCIKAGASLTDSGIVQLQGYVFALKNISDNFALQAANLTLQNADQALKQISVATQTADHALDKLARIDKAVKIASAVVVLGAAITTRDPLQIISATKLVMGACGVTIA